MALVVEKWNIPSLEQPRQGYRGEGYDDPTISYYKIEGIWIEVSTWYEFDGYSIEIGLQGYERIDEPDLSGAKLLKRKKVANSGNTNQDIAWYIHWRFTRPSIMLYAGLVKEVMKSLRLID